MFWLLIQAQPMMDIFIDFDRNFGFLSKISDDVKLMIFFGKL